MTEIYGAPRLACREQRPSQLLCTVAQQLVAWRERANTNRSAACALILHLKLGGERDRQRGREGRLSLVITRIEGRREREREKW